MLNGITIIKISKPVTATFPRGEFLSKDLTDKFFKLLRKKITMPYKLFYKTANSIRSSVKI